MKKISFIVPSRNNISYLKWCYNSIRNNLDGQHEILLADDASSDGTWEWLQQLEDDNIQVYKNETTERTGIVYWYDFLCEKAVNDIVMFFHSDMYACPGLDSKIVELIEPTVIVAATRIEPPLHPDGPEKLLKDFGIEPEDFKEEDLLHYVRSIKNTYKNKVTEGVFAPWAIHKEDYWSVGGHDKLFAPQSKEDSDIWNRLQLNGCSFKQTWEGFVYHLTSRGSRFNPMAGGAPGKDSQEWIHTTTKNMRNFIRKWGTVVQHDESMKPIVSKKYHIGFVVQNCGMEHLRILEPWCSIFYSDCSYENVKKYQKEEQPNTLYNLTDKLRPIPTDGVEDSDIPNITIEFDCKKLTNENMQFITKLSDIITESGELGSMEWDIFKLTIHSMENYEKELIKCQN